MSNKHILPDYTPKSKASVILPGMKPDQNRTAAPTRDMPTSTDDVGGYMTIHDQECYFEGMVYVTEPDAIMAPDGMLLDSKRFANTYGGYEFQMQHDGARPTRNAWEAFTQNRCQQFPKVRRCTFDPDRPFGDMTDNTVNLFKPYDFTPVEGDPSPFLDLMARQLPDERDRGLLLAWMCAVAQNPGKKMQWAPVLQGLEGNGKTFLLYCLRAAVGPHLTHLPNPDELNEKYNAFVETTLLVGVEEIHMSGRRSMLDGLKKYVTNDFIEARAMRTDGRMVRNLTNWMFLTNWMDAIVKTDKDRRYGIFFMAQQNDGDLERDGMNGTYFRDLWNWGRAGGFDIVATYLRQCEIPEVYCPIRTEIRAPDTTSTAAAINASRGWIEQELLEAIEAETQGFRGGWINSIKARELVGNRVTANALSESIKALGYVKCAAYTDGRSSPLVSDNLKRPRLYCIPEHNINGFTSFHYETAQGFAPPGSSADVVVDE